MPTAAGGKPQTVVYPLAGTENVCLGTSEAECNIFNVRSLAWDGESIRAALMIRPNHAKAIEKDLTIPLSKFVLVGK
jgi:hypothetical protein